MPDFIYDIRDKFLDGVDVVRSYLPAELDNYTEYFVPGIAGVAGAIAIVVSLLSGKAANQLESRAETYRHGQVQLEATLGEGEAVELSQDATENLGRSDMILQYRQLAKLDGGNTFSNMESMANVSTTAEEAASYDVDNSFFQMIPGFAGDFGGVLVKRSNQGGNADIRMAAYVSEQDMVAPTDNTVMNVLVQHLTRIIPSTQYGVPDKKNTLVILSGTDIRSFSVIQKGSVMYTLFGKSTGSKVSRKYICTGIEPGSLGEVSDAFSDGSSETTVNDVLYTVGRADITGPGSIYLPMTGNEVKSVAEDGTVTYTDGTIVKPNGVVVYSDGTVVDTDGTVYYPDGMVVNPDGTISGGSVTYANGESGSNSEEPDSQSSTSAQSSSTIGNDGREFEGEADSRITRHVFAADGTEIIDNKTHDLIFYMMNSQTGAVTVTYWDLAGSDIANTALSSSNY